MYCYHWYVEPTIFHYDNYSIWANSKEESRQKLEEHLKFIFANSYCLEAALNNISYIGEFAVQYSESCILN